MDIPQRTAPEDDISNLAAVRANLQYFKNAVFPALCRPFRCKSKAVGGYFINDKIGRALGRAILGKVEFPVV